MAWRGSEITSKEGMSFVAGLVDPLPSLAFLSRFLHATAITVTRDGRCGRPGRGLSWRAIKPSATARLSVRLTVEMETPAKPAMWPHGIAHRP